MSALFPDKIEQLRTIECALGEEPGSLDTLYARARTLEALGRSEEAKAAYLAVLAVDPRHFGALNDIGTLLYRLGQVRAARTALSEAVRQHPDNPIGLANLAAILLDDGQTDLAGLHYETALRFDPNQQQAHQSLAVMHLRKGDDATARRHAQIGFGTTAITTWPYRGEGVGSPVLLVHSALGGNLHTDRFLDDRVFAKATLVAEFHDPAESLPDVPLIFNGIGDADRCRAALLTAAAILPPHIRTINRPAAVLATDRVTNSRRLATLPGVITATTLRCTREQLAGPGAEVYLAEHGIGWPVLLRAPGFHTGKHFIKAEHPAHLPDALATLPGDELFAMQFLDTRDAAGLVRKYRVMIVDGVIYPYHLAISREWMVHYFTADMTEHAIYRKEEARFLEDMPAAIGPTAMTALQRVRDTLQLEYAGVDFTIGASGELVIFEANATMVVLSPDGDQRWNYRRAAVQDIDEAVRALLV